VGQDEHIAPCPIFAAATTFREVRKGLTITMDKQAFLDTVEADHAAHIALLQKFIQAPSPNPPGDTADAAGVLSDYLVQQGVPVETISP